MPADELTPTFSHAAIKAHHVRLGPIFQAYLEDFEAIRPPPEYIAPWERRRLDNAEFLLWGASKLYGKRSNTDRTMPVVRSIEHPEAWGENYAWVGWRQTWTRPNPNRDKYCLLDTSFTFFWGRFTTIGQEDSQVFRAEWSQEIFGTEEAGHPHWHVDLFPLVYDVSKIHFGMAGWELERNGDEMTCWQTFVENDLGRLEGWCDKVLGYSIRQLYSYL